MYVSFQISLLLFLAHLEKNRKFSWLKGESDGVLSWLISTVPQRAAVTMGSRPTTTAESARQGVAKTQLYLEKIKINI